MSNWSDGKKFLFEDIFVYSLGLSLVVAHDWLRNLALSTHLIVDTHNPYGYPYEFGLWQIVIGVFFLVQLVRKVDQWRYYA